MSLSDVLSAVVPGSPEQQAGVDAAQALQPGESLAVNAKAGTGKTFLLEKAAATLRGRVLVLVFNRRGQVELQARVRVPAGSTLRIQTFDAYAKDIVPGGYGPTGKPHYGKAYVHAKNQSGPGYIPNVRTHYVCKEVIDLAMGLGVGLPGERPCTVDTFRYIIEEYAKRVPKGSAKVIPI